ncbi:tetratricopeptide repeat protein [Alistipes dispar]|uniref:tetratricopeptide repeat protein n=1 Tax=Alistipes dispar TaxID=2585119 RepID=UPI00248BDE23|nr:tetratricopeptide repeat protein [Alistipes dispar]
MKRLIITLVLLFGLSALSAQEGAAPAGEPRTDSVAASGDAATAAGERADDSGAESSAGSLWDRANTAYINGDYHAALEMYERILAGGMGSAKLYYNLANACFKEGQTGRAILFYHRALRLAPGSDDIRYNLSVAEARTKDRIEEIPAFFLTEWVRAVRRTMSCTAWSVLSLAALAFALGLFLLYLLAPRLSLRKAGFYGTAVAAALFVLTTWFAAGERREMLDDSQAVVMAASTAVKSSPDKSATDLFVLHEGTLVKISDRLEGWCEITIADGKKGWLECRTIERI